MYCILTDYSCYKKNDILAYIVGEVVWETRNGRVDGASEAMLCVKNVYVL